MARLFWLAMVLAGAHVLVGIGLAVVGNPEGWVGGIFYVAVYALPAFLIGLALRSGSGRWLSAAGWVALFLGIYYTAVPIGNWSGYTAGQAVFAVLITLPTVVFDLLVFWAAVLHHPRPLGV